MKGTSLRKVQRKKKLFYTGVGTIIIIICSITSVFTLDLYCEKIFPGIPYRKHFAYYLDEIVLRGLIISPLTNALFTKSENLSSTKLPVWEIQLSGRKLAELNRDLPSSGRIYQSGTVIIDSSPFPARFRFRGDSFWHWKSKQKSWKIQLRRGQRYEGKREFNLVNPRSITTLIWPLASYIAHSMGLKTPRLQHVHARLNGQYLGVLYLVENFDHDFIVQNGFPEGALYGDEALGPFSHQSWKEIDTWYIRPPESKQKYQAGKNPEGKYEKYLNELLSCINLKDDEEFFHKLEEVVDVHQYLKWWAHTIICLDIHQDRKHNNRLYIDPTSAKFQQIPWDMFVGGDPQGEIDLNLNPITERLLQSPEYVHARNKIIWEAIQGPASINKQIQWLDKMASLIREDIYCDPHKDARFFIFPPLRSILSKKMILSMCILPVSNSMFERDLSKIKTFIRERIAYIEQILLKTDSDLFFYSAPSADLSLPSQYVSVGLLNLKVGGQEGIVVKEIRIHFKSPFPLKNAPFIFYGNSSQLIKIKGKNTQKNIFSEDRVVYTFKVNELLLPGRRKKPPFDPVFVRYPFAVAFINSKDFLPAPLGAEVSGVHPLTNEEIFFEAPLSELKADSGSITVGKFQPHSPSPRRIFWKGLKKLEKDFKIEKDELLILLPHTRIELADETSILSYGKIMAIGRPTSPIVFTRAPDSTTWGVVALQGSKASGSVFENCIFEYGSDDEIDRVFYSGALSIYNADATIKDCLFRFNQGDDALNIKFSSTDVLQSKFISNKADAYDLDFSNGLIAKNLFEKNGNDGIDCGTSHPTINDNRISHCKDKGISIGEGSNPVVENNLITHCTVGVAVKDKSCPEIKKNEFQFNKIAIAAYQKKKVFGGANVSIHESGFRHNEHISESDEVSSVSLIDCVIDDDS